MRHSPPLEGKGSGGGWRPGDTDALREAAIVSRASTHPQPLPSREGRDCFANNATRLAGIAGALLGWRPADFWSATPAELEAVLTAFAGPDAAAPPTHATIASLKERFPDG